MGEMLMVKASSVDTFRDYRWTQYARVRQLAHGNETWVRFGSAVGLAVLTGVLAQVSIITPLTPVPYTLQVLGVSLMGGLLGRRWGSTSAFVYVLLGVIGFPMYAGQWAVYDGFELFGGWAVFTGGLTAGYLLGFVAYAYLVGMVRDAEAPGKIVSWIGGLGASALIVFAFVDAYFVANYRTLYPDYGGAYPNPWFGAAVVGLLSLVGAVAYVGLRSRGRRERVDLFLANLAGLVVLYAMGAVWFAFMWVLLGNPALGLVDLLRLTVIPFIPAGVTKVLLAVGIVSVVQPTGVERQRRMGGDAGV